MQTRYALALASLLLIPAVHAKDHGDHTPPPGMADHSPMMADADDAAGTDGLNLTAEQKTQIGAIRADAKTRHQAIHEETHAKIRVLLTPEQQKTFDARKAERQDKRHSKKEMKEMKKMAKDERKEERKREHMEKKQGQ